MGEVGWVSCLGGLQQSLPVGCKCLQKQTELLEQGTAPTWLLGSRSTWQCCQPRDAAEHPSRGSACAAATAEPPGAAEEDCAEWVHLYVNHIHFSWLPG